ncbi:hypothetical protein GCM10010344_76540 [Streptomyces bluensis]|nr:hypothetical protein GCM10010344_76540 [Streptomyces bluensis]
MGAAVHRSADLCPPAAVVATWVNRAEICTDRAGVCPVGWTGDDLAARPGPRRAAAGARASAGPRGWSYDELAARSGLSRRTVIEIEQGRTIGSLKTWHALAHVLGTPFDELFGTLCRGHDLPRPVAD